MVNTKTLGKPTSQFFLNDRKDDVLAARVSSARGALLRKRALIIGRPDGANGDGLEGAEDSDLVDERRSGVFPTGAHSGSDSSPPSMPLVPILTRVGCLVDVPLR